MRSSSAVRLGLLRRPCEAGAARVEFAVIVAIFATWVMVSVAMFQQGVRDVYTAAAGDTTLTTAASPTSAPSTLKPAIVAAPSTVDPSPMTAGPSKAASATPARTTPTTAAPTTAARAQATAAEPTKAAPPTRAAPTTAPPTSAAPVEPAPATPTAAAPTTVAPEPATVGPTAPEPPTPAVPTTAVPTTAVPTTPPVAGPILALTESVDKKGTLASNLLPGLSPEATLAAIDIVSGGGEIVYTTPDGDYVFNAPNGRNTTVIAFTYVQGEIPVTDNTLTISTG